MPLARGCCCSRARGAPGVAGAAELLRKSCRAAGKAGELLALSSAEAAAAKALAGRSALALSNKKSLAVPKPLAPPCAGRCLVPSKSLLPVCFLFFPDLLSLVFLPFPVPACLPLLCRGRTWSCLPFSARKLYFAVACSGGCGLCWSSAWRLVGLLAPGVLPFGPCVCPGRLALRRPSNLSVAWRLARPFSEFRCAVCRIYFSLCLLASSASFAVSLRAFVFSAMRCGLACSLFPKKKNRQNRPVVLSKKKKRLKTNYFILL